MCVEDHDELLLDNVLINHLIFSLGEVFQIW